MLDVDYVGLHYTALVLKTKHIIVEWEIMCISISICRIEPDHAYKAFLASSPNKQVSNLLGKYMINVDTTVQRAEGDSDYKICTVACRSAQAKPTDDIEDDTDICQLLIHHADLSDYYENM